MDHGYPIRSAFPIEYADLLRGMNEPETAAKQSVNRMFTQNRTPKAIKDPQSDGVPCPTCGKAHRAGTICDFDKSLEFQRALEEITKGGSNRWPAGTGQGKGGQFAPKGSGTPTKGMRHSGPGGGGAEKKKKKQVKKPEEKESGKQFDPSATGAATPQAKRQEEAVSPKAEQPKAGSFDPSATGAASPKAKRQESPEGGESSMSQKLRAMQQGSKEKGEKLIQAGKERSEKDPFKARMERAAQDKSKYERVVGEKMEADPKAFEGGVHTPRKERAQFADTMRAGGSSSESPLTPRDAYEAAQVSSGKRVYEQAHQAAIDAGANPVEAAVAANQAWRQNFEAHEAARRAGGPIPSVEDQQAAIAGARTMPAPAPEDRPTMPPIPSPTNMPTASPTQSLEQWQQGQQSGATPQVPGGITIPPDQGEMELIGPQGTPAGPPSAPSPEMPVTPPATPGDGTPPTRPPRFGAGTQRQERRWPGIGFSQAYGAGQAIGSAEGTPGGVVTPYAGLAAQQVHHLLNPQIRRYAAPAVAGSPKTSVGGAGPISPGVKSSQSSLQHSTAKSMEALISWKQKYEQRF